MYQGPEWQTLAMAIILLDLLSQLRRASHQVLLLLELIQPILCQPISTAALTEWFGLNLAHIKKLGKKMDITTTDLA